MADTASDNQTQPLAVLQRICRIRQEIHGDGYLQALALRTAAAQEN